MADQPLFGVDLSELRQVRAKEVAVRFAFGAGISIVAGVGASVLGSVVGGLLLAFPAVLPAALTLVEQRDGTDAAVHEVGGAVFGALGLAAFAAVVWALLPRVSALVALPAALAAWAAVSIGLYALRATGVLPTAAPLEGERALTGEIRAASRRAG